MWDVLVRIILKYRLLILICVFSLTLFIGWYGLRVQMSYEMAQMLPSDHPAFVDYEEFRSVFGVDGNIMFVGVEDADFFVLENMENWVNTLKEIRNIEGVSGIVSINNLPIISRNDEIRKFEFHGLFEELPQEQFVLDSLIHKAFQQKFYDGLLFNSESGVVLTAISLKQEILNTQARSNLIDDIYDRLFLFEQETSIDLKYSGLPYIRTRTAQKIEAELGLFVILGMIVASIFLFFFFRSFKAFFFPMLIVGISVIWAFGLISFLGFEITVLTGVLPPLLIVICVENCIFLLNKYHNEYKRHRNKELALKNIVLRVGKATMLANATTAVGFAAFVITGNKMLVEFGVVAAINILVVFLLTLFLIPIFFSYIKPPDIRHVNHLDGKFLRNAIGKVVHVVSFHRNYVYVFFLLLFGVGLWGISKLETSGSIVDDLPQRDPVYRDLLFFEEHINGILPLEFMIETHRPNGAFHPRTLDAIEQFQEVLAQYDELSKPLSVVELFKYAKQGFYRGNTDMYELPNRHERNFIMSYLPSRDAGDQSNMLNSLLDSAAQTTRLSVQMSNIGTNRIQEIQDELQPAIDSIFNPEETRVIMTGTSVLFLKGTSYLINNLLTSLVFAVIIIAILMALLFNNIRMILISLLPNLFPQLLTAALMGFIGVPIKPSTILVFSIALGISVDNSIHFLAKYKQELALNNNNIKHSVISSLRESGISMLYTFVVLFFGFIIFTASSFGGTQAMGYLIGFTLLVALMSNLFLLPSVLLSLHKRIS